MRVRKIYAIALLMLIALLSGCGSTNKRDHLVACGSYAVPGMDCSDLKGNHYTCEMLEEDSYGRVLFSYEIYNVVSGKEENALIVCQLMNGEDVYFYEDVCFLIGDYNDEDIVQIKEKNDWERKPNPDKMTRREVRVTFDLTLVMHHELDYKTVRESCFETLGVDEAERKEFCLCYVNEKGYGLYYLALQTEEGLEKYWVISDLEHNIYAAPVNEDLNNIESLIELKKESGWY